MRLEINLPPGTRIHPSCWHLLDANQLHEQQGLYRKHNGGALPPKVPRRRKTIVVPEGQDPHEAARLMTEAHRAKVAAAKQAPPNIHGDGI